MNDKVALVVFDREKLTIQKNNLIEQVDDLNELVRVLKLENLNLKKEVDSQQSMLVHNNDLLTCKVNEFD